MKRLVTSYARKWKTTNNDTIELAYQSCVTEGSTAFCFIYFDKRLPMIDKAVIIVLKTISAISIMRRDHYVIREY